MSTITTKVSPQSNTHNALPSTILTATIGIVTVALNAIILVRNIPPIMRATIGTADKTIINDAHTRLLDSLQLHYEIGTLLLILFGAAASFLLTRIGGSKFAVGWFLMPSLVAYAEWSYGVSVHDLTSNEQPNYLMLRALAPSLPVICWIAIAVVVAFAVWLKVARPKFQIKA